MRIAAIAAAFLPVTAFGYTNQPPVGHAGGFGEPDCTACHFPAGPGPGQVALELEGLPARYRPGMAYSVEIRLSAPGMAAAGIAVTARLSDGTQAGSWRAGRGLEVAAQGEIGYLRHLEPATGAPANWSAQWTAPESCAGQVIFHAAGNAANRDDSALGDRVVTKVVKVPPANCLHE